MKFISKATFALIGICLSTSVFAKDIKEIEKEAKTGTKAVLKAIKAKENKSAVGKMGYFYKITYRDIRQAVAILKYYEKGIQSCRTREELLEQYNGFEGQLRLIFIELNLIEIHPFLAARPEFQAIKESILTKLDEIYADAKNRGVFVVRFFPHDKHNILEERYQAALAAKSATEHSDECNQQLPEDSHQE